jgi:uncharacterized protein YdaU (DUF1376 family)
MAEFPHMRLWTADYLGDTTHLTTIEHGAYMLLLMTAWRSKAHCLPDDDLLLQQYTKTRAHQWKRIRPRLEPFFEINNGFWFHMRMLDEIEAIKRQRNQKSIAGTRGALQRWNRSRKYRTKAESMEPNMPSRATRLDEYGVHDLASKPLKTLNMSMAAECRLDSGAIANHSHTDKKEETEKEKSQPLNGSEHLRLAMEKKGWLPH